MTETESAPASVSAVPPNDPATPAGFAELRLCQPILRALAELGYQNPTPIQSQAIPLVLAGRDLMGGAQTGTGKTAAFALPMLERLRPHASSSVSPARHPVRALILTPTRELAAQVEESIRDYGRHVGLRSTCVFGGVSIDPQIAALRAGVEIVVATPGRLLDHVQQRTIAFQSVEFLVLDEADRMLDMGFMPDIRRILALLPPRRQNLLFSATFPDEILKLAGALLTDPVRVEVARRNAAAETVAHVIHMVGERDKRTALVNLVRSRNIGPALIFTRTRLAARQLTRHLQREGLSADDIHSDKSQAERLEALGRFKSGLTRLLVATDIAARGLDIEQLPHVINYEMPHAAEDYVHRTGRTGRAGLSGEAISLVCGTELDMLAGVEKLIKRALPREPLPAPPAAARGPARRAPAESASLPPHIAAPYVAQTGSTAREPRRPLERPGVRRRPLPALLASPPPLES